jgi:PAS domain S-box-containing protein
MYYIRYSISSFKLFPILFLIFTSKVSLSSQKDIGHYDSDSLNEKITIDQLNQIALQSMDSSSEVTFKNCNEAIMRSKKLNYYKGEAESYINLGLCYTKSFNFLKAHECYFTALKIVTSKGLISYQPDVYKKIGSLCTRLKRFDEAFNYLQKGLRIANANKDTFNICDIYIFLGQISNETGFPDKALFYYNKAKQSLYVFPNPNLISKVNRALGDLYLSLKDYSKAQYFYQKVIETNTNSTINYANNSGAVLSLLAYISEIKHDFRTSLKFNKLALTWRQEHKQQDQYISSLINTGSSFLNLKEFDSACWYLNKGLSLANKFNLYRLKEQGYKNLYYYYFHKQNWNSALHYYILFSEAKDSVFAVNNRFNMSLFETNQILSETEKKNEILKNENDIQKLNIRIKTIEIIVLLIFICLVFFILALVYRLYIRNKRSKLKLKAINGQLDQEIEDRKKIEQQLRESESLHRFLTENSMDVICRTGKDLKISYISPSCRNIYGFEPAEMLALKRHADIIHPDFYKDLKIEFDDMIKSREPTKFTYRTLSSDGTYFWAESHVNPIFDEAGELKELISVVRDVTHRIDQEEALEESAKQKELLIREIHHRAKNNFAILISLMNLQLEQTSDEEIHSCLGDLKFRVHTMALVHDQLHRSKNIITLSFSEYLVNLVNVVSKAFRADGIVVHTEIEECYFHIESALPLGLIVNELLTNAFKYAFINRPGGNIWVEFRSLYEDETDPELDDIYWILTVRDDGVGLPAGFDINSASTLGIQILTVLTGQLQARLKINITGGTSVSILLPEQD